MQRWTLPSGSIKNSIIAVVFGVVGLLAMMQWTSSTVRKHVRIASQSLFPAALNSQRAGTVFQRMNREYSDAVVMQQKTALDTASRDAATIMSSLENAGKSMEFNPKRHQQIVTLMGRIGALQARSRFGYSAAANLHGDLPASLQTELEDLGRETQAVQTALETLQSDLASDFHAELTRISNLLRMQATFEAVLLVCVIIALFVSTRALIDRQLSAQQVILDNERKMLRALIDNIPDFMYVKDRQSKFVIANAHTARILGANSFENLLGKTDFDFFPQPLAAVFRADEQEVMRSGQPMYNREEKGIDAAGNETYVLTTKVPLRDSKGLITGIAGTGRDISERKKTEEALRKAHQQAEFFINAVPSILIGLDRESRITRWNLAGAMAFGLPVSAVAGKPLGDCGIKWLRPDMQEDVRSWCADRRPQRRDSVLFEKKGQKRALGLTITPVHMADGDPTSVLVIGSDITDRGKVEDALHEAERNYRGIFNDAIVGIFQSTPQGGLLSANPAMARILGYDSPESLLATLSDISGQLYVDPNRRDEFKLLMDKLGVVQNFEVEVFRKDGGKIWIAISGRAIRKDGVVVRYEGMTEDVTQRKLLQTQLLQAQKLESVGHLAAGIAHEINTPTQYIGDNVRFLKDAFQDLKSLLENYERLLVTVRQNDPAPQAIEEVVAAIEGANAGYLFEEIPKAIDQTLEGVTRVATLVSAMKEFSHPGTKEKTPLDLNHAIQSTITVARNEWKYVADVVTDFDPALPLVSCQPGEFNQVILNLIVNAAHAIADVVGNQGSKRGKITVQTRDYPEWTEIRIQDSGSGIPEKVRARIFDPFFTTKEIGKGTGQGLAIARSVVVDKHGGSIHFETEDGKGTTFIIRLPHDDKVLEAKAGSA